MAQKRLKTEVTTVDQTTGEILTIEKKFTVQTTGETFFMTFISSLAGFYRITSITDVKVLTFLCENAHFNTGKVSLTAAKRKELIAKAEINNRQTVTNSLKRLKSLALISGKDGEYEINPTVFWKGSTAEREKLLKSKGRMLHIQFTTKTDSNGV